MLGSETYQKLTEKKMDLHVIVAACLLKMDIFREEACTITKPLCFQEPGSGHSITKAFCIAFVMTFFSVFDVPVFWPILLCYWVVLFVLTMKRQIAHMIKYRYVPFNIGKQVDLPP
ncbi:Protein RER1B [Bienertia sinuspersici]